jgi:hypothetical protein
MAWVFLELAVVIALAAGIVWWTLPKKPKGGRDDGTGQRPDEPPKG